MFSKIFKGEAEKICGGCGQLIIAKADFCPKCGVPQAFKNNQDGTDSVPPPTDHEQEASKERKSGWLSNQFSSAKNMASSFVQESYGFLGVDEKVEWMKSQASLVSDATSSTTDRILSYYSEAEFIEKYGPYLQKAILTVAADVAAETLNDEEQLLTIFGLFIDFIPTPLRLLIKSSKSDKFVFRLILNMRGDLLEQVEAYRLQIASSENPNGEVKLLSTTINNEIEKLPKDNVLPEVLSNIGDEAPVDPNDD